MLSVQINGLLSDLQYTLEELFDDYHNDVISHDKLMDLISEAVDDTKQNIMDASN